MITLGYDERPGGGNASGRCVLLGSALPVPTVKTEDHLDKIRTLFVCRCDGILAAQAIPAGGRSGPSMMACTLVLDTPHR